MSALLKLFAGVSGWKCGNAGDEFSAPLLRALLEREVRVMAEPEAADLFAAGSILHQLPPTSRAVVWGSGLIREEDRVAAPDAKPLALRGRLTANRWRGCRCDVFGDPGLLVSRVWFQAPAKRYRLGIVPHYVDHDSDAVRAVARRSEDVTTIDICGRVADVLRAISECEVIVSSSLHGIVFAESYGIPSAWIRLSDKLVGGSFKFRDYRSAFGLGEDWVPMEFTGHETIAELASRARGETQVDSGARRKVEEALLAVVEAIP